jgi:GNAT superfamily N-acetyltransferase
MSIAVRPATPADIPALCRMKMSLLALEDSLHVSTASEDDWRRDGFGPNAKFTALIAEIDGAPAGMATFSKRGFPGWDGSAFFLHDLYVEEVHRGRGCARALMAALAAEAQAENAAFIELTVDASNRAREFYQRMGFAHVSHCMTYVAAQPALSQLAAAAPR